jgi:hypothetical protein
MPTPRQFHLERLAAANATELSLDHLFDLHPLIFSMISFRSRCARSVVYR